MRRCLLTSFALAASSTLAAAPTTASAADNALPGVETGYRIVKPLPPEPDDPPPAGPRTFKLGNFDVEVHGKISIEFGFGEQPRRRK